MPAAILSRANTVSVRAQSAPKAQKPAPAKPVLKAAPIAAAFAAISLMAASSPAFAAVDEAELKKVVCAANPTAKICLKDSAKDN
mmetsp:Transcript_27270/g.73699  ORF Transcript_27270/g.73699 Transcript_27270/m.73699 type:complete len:85 (-) Transcript_27270:305-559(-)|eukprot:CAMPEP_0202337794 /NCGR_PEP_ID=MMETSP1126-20121109/338_1 /ASSEMBLY_ACC=CAM_ASM_000457 /TAXON_ID=3047 /ORGANISM="Dunaliella tertiolecta, Strain CCMP1320" /LENGTH=84 /DNA_ID=CAMNT_0048928065 /DNA_START=120 /DNA_END=374 /DNA_ORIENTATION=-